MSEIPPGNFLSRTFPPNPNHKPNPNSNCNPNANPLNPNPTDPTLTLTLLTPLLTLTLTKQCGVEMSEGELSWRRELPVSRNVITRAHLQKVMAYSITPFLMTLSDLQY